MFFRAWNTAIGDMGYALSRLEIDPDFSDSESSPVGDDHESPQPSSQNELDHEVAHLTKLRSQPHDNLKRVLPLLCNIVVLHQFGKMTSQTRYSVVDDETRKGLKDGIARIIREELEKLRNEMRTMVMTDNNGAV
nr:LEC14B protein-like [Tanacetum cinerariifolium]